MKKLTRYGRNMRKKRTKAESILFNLLLQWKIKFRTQRPFGQYIVDFLIPEKRIIIEVDGSYHKGREKYDWYRTQFLEKQGFKVIRISNKEVFNSDCQELRKKILSYPNQKIIQSQWRKVYGFAKY